jgi:hypothetical protein
MGATTIVAIYKDCWQIEIFFGVLFFPSVIQQQMEFDRSLGPSESDPVKDPQAQNDRGRG